MDRRVILTVLMSMAVIFVWTKWFMPPPPKPLPPAVKSVASPASAPSPASGAATASAGSPASPASAAAGSPTSGALPAAAPAVERLPEKREIIERAGLYRATFSSWGAGPVEWRLLHPQYKEGKPGKAGEPMNLLRTAKGVDAFVVSFPDSGFAGPSADAAWTPLEHGADELAYAWESPEVRIEKRYRFQPKTYDLSLQISVENRSDHAIDPHLSLRVAGWQDPTVKPGGMFSAHVAQTEGLCDLAGKLKKGDLATLLKEPLAEVGAVHWIGVGEQYFVSAVSVGGQENRKCVVSAVPEGTILAAVQLEGRKLEPGKKTSYSAVGFFGPKILSQLDDVQLDGNNARLHTAVDYGWYEVLARPMLGVLKAVHLVVPNWGLAIILLTVLIKLVTYWPTQKSMQSMKAMARLKPEMDKLQKQYANDKARLNQEVMGLYKKHGVNPLGGCLPMLIQMPIYIALYGMLGNSVELYRSAFFGPIQDLTAPDPYFVMPVLTGVLMFAQQKLSPTPADDTQKAMMYMMPVMFTAFSIFLPAGLTIYILTNTLLTMAQQWVMNRGDRAAKTAA